ncbi:uncharacterized protein LACBIDRAFT_322536 [Laccaria bicolor S238N-H82]|uniref:Predicted protein n=1 Tax=Laccaria bicolor (strain S238N-H82 / ATCC MYA-4686) TaxID=486041 RepID=B0CWM9_LACBS|nr:uncharacterized protein LACBIDRAFT_322536 [Laccaria bicolor S238N-H82]EDR13095.1 predicted protein [Laccaria bicolor S238N-H82]|eukprot:XP_001875593.1 predicted protein [Laccaria bicolor S238N-H82]
MTRPAPRRTLYMTLATSSIFSADGGVTSSLRNSWDQMESGPTLFINKGIAKPAFDVEGEVHRDSRPYSTHEWASAHNSPNPPEFSRRRRRPRHATPRSSLSLYCNGGPPKVNDRNVSTLFVIPQSPPYQVGAQPIDRPCSMTTLHMRHDEPIVTKKQAGELKTLMQQLIPDCSQKSVTILLKTHTLRGVLRELLLHRVVSRLGLPWVLQANHSSDWVIPLSAAEGLRLQVIIDSLHNSDHRPMAKGRKEGEHWTAWAFDMKSNRSIFYLHMYKAGRAAKFGADTRKTFRAYEYDLLWSGEVTAK